MATECEVLSYLLGLADLATGLSGEGARIYQRTLTGEAVPLLRKQQEALEAMWLESEEGLPVTDRDAAVLALDAELEAVWSRCLEQLRTLWLTSPHAVVPEEVVP